jgi:Carboxypeptidase regulatory-like domain
MKLVWCYIIGSFLLVTPARSQQAVSGDILKWNPFDSKTNSKDAQIVRNSQYVSIQIQAAHVSYKSGFLENIKQIVVSSSVSFDLQSQKVDGLIVNRTWDKSKTSDDDMPVHDLLADLSPASPTSIKIKVDFAGIGQDRFKPIFDILANSDVKTALNLSPTTLAKSGLATSILQKFLATPYTSNNPKSVLSMSVGFVLYSNRDADRVDSLRQGYVVVISGSENKSQNLDRVINIKPDSLRFDAESHVLQTKLADGSWVAFTGNSYVVLSVTADSVRGIDESSPWAKKFYEGERTTDQLVLGESADKVKKDALNLWQEGSTLLAADANYIERERQSIRAKALYDIQEDLKKKGGSLSKMEMQSFAPEIPSNFAELAKSYDSDVLRTLAAALALHIHNAEGSAMPGASISLRDVRTMESFNATTNNGGDVVLNGLKPGDYELEVSYSGFAPLEQHITVQPKERKGLTLTLASGT